MAEESGRIRKKMNSLSVRLPIMFVLSGVLIIMIVIPVVYFRFKQRMIDQYTRMGQGVTNMMTQYMDADKVDEYLERNIEMPEYQEIRNRFKNLRENYPDVVYMYVYRFEPDGCHVVFDMDNAAAGGDEPGSVCELDPSFRPYLDKLCAGGQIPALTDHTKSGYLLTYARPVFNGRGEYQCHVCVDFSMNYVYEKDLQFLISILGILTIAVALILLVDIKLTRKKITGPINKMVQHIKGFTYETEEDRFRNVQIMEELNVSTQDEIEDLYLEFMSVMKESLYYMTNFNRAKHDIQNKEDEIGQISAKAFKDVLTGVGNPAAYDKATALLTKELSEKRAKFAIVMADVNNLKFINDTYGHERGDQYIMGCCSMICGIYKHSPVYRVGGDEFIVILKNEDYAGRTLRLTKIREAFVGTYLQQEKPDWERYSASIGMAEVLEGDQSVGEVLKRADEAMYEEKMAFKKKFGSYR